MLSGKKKEGSFQALILHLVGIYYGFYYACIPYEWYIMCGQTILQGTTVNLNVKRLLTL